MWVVGEASTYQKVVTSVKDNLLCDRRRSELSETRRTEKSKGGRLLFTMDAISDLGDAVNRALGNSKVRKDRAMESTSQA